MSSSANTKTVASQWREVAWQPDFIAPGNKPWPLHWGEEAIHCFECKHMTWWRSIVVNSQVVGKGPLHTTVATQICPHNKFAMQFGLCLRCPKRVEQNVWDSPAIFLRCITWCMDRGIKVVFHANLANVTLAPEGYGCNQKDSCFKGVI